jgi:hypothetical protein
MNALRALLAAAKAQRDPAEGQLAVQIGGVDLPPIAIDAADLDVVRKIDLTPHAGTGTTAIRLSFTGTGEVPYRVSRRIYRAPQTQAGGPFQLTVSYGRGWAAVGDTVQATISALYTGAGRHDQVLVRAGLAPGLVPNTGDLERIVSEGRASRAEVRAGEVVFYLMGLEPRAPRDLSFRMTATVAMVALIPGSSISSYYEPGLRAETPPVQLTVTGQ